MKLTYTKRFIIPLLVFFLLISEFSIARDITHNVANGSLTIPSNSTDHYIITGTTTNTSHYVVVQSGFVGTVTLRNLDMAFSGSGANSPIRITGQNNRSNLNPVTKVTLVLDGNSVITNRGGGRACIQVDQGAQIHIKAKNPAYNLSGTLCVQNTGGGAAIGALDHYANTNECTGSAQIQGTAHGAGRTGLTAGGNIVISSGLVTTKGAHGAGLGGGYTTYYDGIIFIYGGIVKATAVYHAAGIGSGCPTGSGVIDAYSPNSTTIVLPPAKITATGADRYEVVARLGLAGTKTLVYIGDENKPLVTVRTEDHKAGAPIYADLSQNPDIVRAYNAVFGSETDQLDIHKVNFGKTDATGTFSFRGILQNATTFFTDATSDHNQHYGEPYASTTTTLTSGGSVVLNRIGIDFSLQIQPSTPLLRGYSSSDASSHAFRVKMIYRDNTPLTGVTFSMASGSRNQFGTLKYYQSDGVTERPCPTTLSNGDVFYISIPLAAGKSVQHYNDVLLISGNKNGNNIGYIRQVVDQWVVNVSQVTSCGSSYVLRSGRVVTQGGCYFDTIVRGGVNGSSTIRYIACDGSTYSETRDASSAPDSLVAVNVVFTPPVSDTIQRMSCDRYTWNGSTYTNSGYYSRRLTSPRGCDSVSVLHLTINRSSSGDVFDTACGSYVWYGDTYSSSVPASQVHTHMLTNRLGCDSTLRLHLMLYTETQGIDRVVVCDSVVWHGTKYVASNNSGEWYTTNRWGCDSTVSLDLIVNHSTNSQVDTTVCDRINWRCGTRTYPLTASSINTYHVLNHQGCDSTVVLNLTVNYSATTYTDSTVCDSIRWNGRTYAESGLFRFDTTTIHSCDSIAHLNLVLNHSNTSLQGESVCDAYVWNSARYTESGLYNHHAKNRWGCDSIAYLNLDVRKSYRLTIDTTVCDSILWNGRNLKSDGNYFYRGSTWQGCDSLLMLTLRVHPSTVGYTSVSACDEYTWFGRTFTESCSPNHHSTNAHGCDSNTILFLTINHGTQSRITRAVCDSLYWKGEWRNVTSEYVFDTLNYNGCDSVVVLNLTVNRSSYDTVRTQQCDYFFWNGYPLFGSDTVSYRTRNSVGCDSLVTLYLTMNYATSSIDTLNSCHPVVWHGAQYSASNNSATYVVENSVGCDSVIRLNLTMPKPYKAAFVLTPDFVEPDNMHFRATDKSEGDLNWRQWSVDDEILPYSHSFEYNYPNHVDSMKVQLIVREKMFGCLDTAARWIPLKGGMPFAPNIFTPERSEQNRFMVYLSNVKTFDINIYTREGALVFHSSDINEHWDGTWMGKGRKCPQAVYTYIVRYTTDISDDIQVKKGTVFLAY